MLQVKTRGGVFGPGGYGGGIFDGSQMGFGGLGSVAFEQAAAGIGADTGAFKWCSKASPCPTGDPRVSALQKALNTALKAHGFKPLTVDGKFGTSTCGAISWAGNLPQSDPLFTTAGVEYMTPAYLVDSSGQPVCKSFTYPTKVGSTTPYIPPSTFRSGLPWKEVSPETATVQRNINNDLTQHGYDPISESGMLDAPTCGAMRVAKDEWGMDYLTAYGGNCQEFQAPRKHAQPVVVTPTPTPAHEDELPHAVSSKKSGVSTAWVIGGLAVAAGVAGLYAARKR